MVHKILLALGVIAATFSLKAQETCASNSRIPYEWPGHNNWFFAPNAYSGSVMNMSTEVVTSVGDAWNPVSSYEGVSAASDDNGNLLFYTNGRKLWKGTGAGVTNTYGGLLEGNENGIANGSASQGVITLRHPLNPDLYYIFTTDDAIAPTKGLNYFTFDANGNHLSGPIRLGGFRTTEGISATLHENGVDVWVTVLESGTGNFNTYLVECTGVVSAPVVSAIGPVVNGNRERGGVSFSWDGNHFASAHANWWPNNNKILSIYQFNKATGVIYDAKNVSAAGWGSPYDVTFSPDNQRVYVSMQSGNIKYIDISSWNEATIRGTWASTGISVGYASMEIGANGSMYVAHGVAGGGPLKKVNGNLNSGTSFSTYNVAGTAGQSHLGLPTMYIPPAEEPDIEEVGPYCDTIGSVDLNTTWICSGINAEDPTNNPTAYSGTGITNQGTGIFSPSAVGVGTYEIIFTHCNVNDTIWIEVVPCVTCTSDLQDITPGICVGETYMLDTLVTDQSAAGVWTIDSMPAGTSPVITTGADTVFDVSNLSVTGGTYKLLFTVTDGTETCYDSVYIIVNPLPTPSLGNDTSICIDASAVIFDAGTYTSYLWQPNGEIIQTISASTTGEYIVTVTDANGCTANDSVVLTVNPLPTPSLGNDTIICFGDGAVVFDAGTYSSYLWQPNGEIIQTISASTTGEYIVTVTDVNGCTANDSVVLTVNPLPTPNLGNDTIICFGDGAVVFDAGTYSSYLWQPNGEIIQTISASTTGEYIVTVTDVNGCTANDSVVLTVNPLPTPSLGNDTIICFGNGAVVFDAGTYSSYLWQPNGEIDQTISTSTGGEYIVTVTDVNGCTANDSVVLTVNPLPTPSLGNDTSICINASAVTFDAGTYISYLWQPNGEIIQTISASTTGEYIVTVTDANGCTANDSVVLTVNPLPTPSLGNDTIICFGDVDVVFDAGTYVSYIWQPNGETDQTISTSIAGEYIVTVTDANGCTANDSIFLTINPLPTPNLGNDTSICIDALVVTFDAGTYSSYLWQPNGETDQTISTSTGGEYIVSVTDINGCTSNDSVVLTVNPLPTPNLGNDTSICIDASAVVFDAGIYSNYLWQPNGETDQTISTSTGGEYIVSVTDVNGCIANDSVFLTINPLPTPDLGNDTSICIDASAVVFDAGTYVNYLWQPNGETDQTIPTSTGGEYIVSVTDMNGCTSNDSVILTVNPLPTPNLGNDTSICIDASSVVFDAGTYTSYLWQPNGETDQTISTSTGGEYIVLVTDMNGCTSNDSVVLTVNPLPTPNLGNDTSICIDASSVVFDAGTYTSYLWQPNSEIAQTISTSTAGEYIVSVTDVNGCIANDSVFLTVNLLPTPNLGVDSTICFGDGDVVFDAGTYSNYLWQPNGEADQTISTSISAEYIVSVTDVNGCTAGDSVMLTVNTLPTPDLGADREICEGGLGITFDAGTFASYLWEPNSETTQTITTNTNGDYIVSVVDVNGCTANDTVNLIVNDLPIIDLGSDVTICPGSQVILDAGPGFKTYMWSDASMQQTVNVSDANAGEFTVLIIDTNGCVARDTVDVVVADELSVDLGLDTAFCDGNTLTLDAGGIAGGVYAWQPNAESTQMIDVTISGTYSVEITDPMGCSGRDTIVVTVNANPTLDLGPDVTVCPTFDSSFTAGSGWSNILWNEGSTTELISVNTAGTYYTDVVDVNGCIASDTVIFGFFNGATVDLGSDITICPGTSASFDAGVFASYVWHSGATTQAYTGVLAEIVYVEVADNNGCLASDTAEIFMATSLPINLGNDTSVCDGATVLLDAGYPSSGYSFLWNTGSTTPTISVSTSGTYGVVVEDVTGCSGSDSIDITINTNPTLDLGPDVTVCPTFDSSFTTGPGWSNILWNEGSTTELISVTTAGTYYADVVDANGCIASDTTIFGFFNSVIVDLGNDKTVCPGSIAQFNAGAFTSYTWQDASVLSTYSSSTEEVVYVTVVDGNGCTGSDTAEVFVRSALLVDLGNDTSVCIGNSVTINSGYSEINGFNWNTGATSEKITVTTSGIYGVEVTDVNGCNGSDSLIVTINPTPIVDLGNDTSICLGASVIFNAGSNWEKVEWNDLTTNPLKTVNTTGTYSVTVTDASGCVGTDAIALVVNQNPTVNLGNDTVVCPGNNVTFKTTPNNFASYVWQNGSTGVTYQTLNPETISVIATDVNGCTAKDTAILTNFPALKVELPDAQQFCEGDSYTIVVPDYDPAEHTYSWSTGSTDPTITVTTTAIYNVFVSNGGGCAGFDTIRVVFTPNPTPILVDTGVCIGEVASFDAGNYASYNWLPNGELTQTISATTTGSYSVTVTDTNNCSGSGSVNLTLYSKPVIPDFPNKEACDGQNILLNPTLPSGTHLWNPSKETSSSITVITSGDYTVSVTNGNGCADSLTMNALFNPNPIIDLGADKGICAGEKVEIGVVNGVDIVAWNIGVVADVLEVSTAGEYIATITDGKGCAGKDTINVAIYENPIATVTADTVICMQEIGLFTLQVSAGNRDQFTWSTGDIGKEISITMEDTYYVTTSNGNGCSTEDTINIGRKCVSTLFVANAFTPNGDGLNDNFGPIGINISEFEFYVFDRWGEEIFYSSDINDKWDGTYKGNTVQVDVYVWKVYYRTEEDYGGLKSRTKVGTVTVLR